MHVDVHIEEKLLGLELKVPMRRAGDARTMTISQQSADVIQATICHGESADEMQPLCKGPSEWVDAALRTCGLVLLVLVWWISAIFVVMVIKVTVGSRTARDEAPFPFPFALTAVSNGVCGILALICSCVMRLHQSTAAVPKMRRDEILKLFCIGLIQGVEIGCNNKVLGYLSVSERTMLNSMNVLAMMGTALCWRLERLGVLRVIAVAFLTIGGALQGLSHEAKQQSSEEGAADVIADAHLKGVFLLIFAMVIGTQRWALMQIVMQHSDPNSALGGMTKMKLMAFIMPVTGTVCLTLAWFSERDALNSEHLLRPELWLSVGKIGVGILALSFAELKLVHLTSALAVQVLSTVHQIPIVVAGVFFFHDKINSIGMSGFGLCLIGALFYVAARRADDRQYERLEEPPPQPPTLYDEQAEGEEDDTELMPVFPALYGVAKDNPGADPSLTQNGIHSISTVQPEDETVAVVFEQDARTCDEI